MSRLDSKTVPEYETAAYLNSPERDILTPKGFLLLMGDLGEKAITKLVEIDGFPHIPISNSYRFHRIRVLEWFAGPGAEVLKELKRSSSSTKTVP